MIFNSNYVFAGSSQVSHIGGSAQKVKFSIKKFLSQCDQIPRKLRNVVTFTKESLMENFIFFVVWLYPVLLPLKTVTRLF